MPSSDEAVKVKILWEKLYPRVGGDLARRGIRAMGIDLMDVGRLRGPRGEARVDGILSSQEREFCGRLDDPPREWAALWAAREAVYKATGGLLKVLPQSWRMDPSTEGELRPLPKRSDRAWDEFLRDYHLKVVAHSDYDHAMALALVWDRRCKT